MVSRHWCAVLAGCALALTTVATPLAQEGDLAVDQPFTDDFSDQGSGWDIDLGEDPAFDGTVRYVDGQYEVMSVGNGWGMIGMSNRTFHDVDFEVTATQVAGPEQAGTTYGVGCRVQPDSSGYHFRVSDSGEAGIVRAQFGWDQLGNWSMLSDWLVEWHPVAAVNPGNASNLLRVVCSGDYLAFYVNGELAGEAHDATFTRGDMALEATSYANRELGERARVRFDDAGAVIPEPRTPGAGQTFPVPQTSDEAHALLTDAITAEGRSDYRGMIARSQAVLAYYQSPGSEYAVQNEITVYQLLGIGYSAISDYPAARENFTTALTMARDLGARWLESRQLTGLARLDEAIGDYDAALAGYRESIAIDQEIGEIEGEAMTLGDIGSVYLSLADYEQALAHFQRSMEIPNSSGIRLREARMLGSIGNVYAALGDHDQALGFYVEALEIFETWGDWGGILVTLGNLANTHNALGDIPRALANYEQSLAGSRELGDRSGEAVTLSNMADLHGRQGAYDSALDLFADAEEIALAIDDQDLQATILIGRGGVYLGLGDGDAALEFYEQGASLAGEVGIRDVEAVALGAAAQVLEDLGEPAQALDRYLEAIRVRESIRSDLSVAAFQSAAAAAGVDVYRSAVRLLVEHGRDEEAFALAEQSRARAFLDGMGNARPDLADGAAAGLVAEERELGGLLAALERDLVAQRSLPLGNQDSLAIGDLEARLAGVQQDYEDLLARIQVSSPAAASLVAATPAQVADVQAGLDADTTLVAYYLTDDSTLAFVVTRDAFEVVDLPITPDEVTDAVESFRTFGLANLATNQHGSLTDLYRGLVTPLELTTPVVGIVAHQALHYVPFAALGEDGAFLGDDLVLFSAPSASSLLLIGDRGERTPTNPLVVGDPATDAGNLAPLDFAVAEARQVAELFGVDPLIGDAATEGAVRARSGQAGILHLAAHGTFNPEAPLFSRLWLAPDGDNDGRLNVHEVYNLDLGRADLVVLSACETQVGELSAGDEVVGLNRAFLSGAPTVVASLWSVDDEATGALMQQFFADLQGGMSKAQALQAAQLTLRSDPDHPEWAHPYYWAAFVLNGDPGEYVAASGAPGDASGSDSTTTVTSATVAASAEGESGSGAGLMLVGAIVVGVAVLGAGTFALRRRRPGSDSPP